MINSVKTYSVTLKEAYCLAIAFSFLLFLPLATIAAFDRIKKEFEFNISSSINFDLNLNNSQSIQDAAQEIMEEVSEELGLLQELKLLLAYLGFFLILFMYLQYVLPVKNK